ncbi:hypothetical protein [Dactylosporangium sp. CA-139066]|uniref:hypothetical protein n=1 Tax=Dactylosporangium sp. CA-139066 TaxID=3239930 RepID=UPI003D8EC6D4
MKRGLLLIPAVALVVGGCRPGADGLVTPEPVASPTTAAVTGPVAFHVRLNAGQSITTRPAPSAGCPGLDARVDLGAAGHVRLAAYASTCSPGDNAQPGNGRHGVYRTKADIPAQRSTTEVRTALGEATVFSQPYYECTNSCHNYTEAVAVIALDKPADPAYPTLVLYAEKGDTTPDRLTALLRDQLAA